MPGSTRPGARCVLLAKQHDRRAFSCGTHPQLDSYLHDRALQDMKRGYAVTHVLPARDGRTIVGYYALTSTQVPVDLVPPEFGRKLPRYPTMPATLLARLAVDRRYRGKGYGALLLIDALLNAYTSGTASIGAAAVVVDAIDDGAVRFYRRYGFLELTDDPTHLFLSMRTVEKLLRDAELVS